MEIKKKKEKKFKFKIKLKGKIEGNEIRGRYNERRCKEMRREKEKEWWEEKR